MTQDDWGREERLDRDFHREPTYGTRRRIPLNERGALKQRFAAPVTKPEGE